jgi:hypothetical protein
MQDLVGIRVADPAEIPGIGQRALESVVALSELSRYLRRRSDMRPPFGKAQGTVTELSRG